MMNSRHEEKPVCGFVGHCDHCGFTIYTAEDLLIVRETGDRIHRDCWVDYAVDHISDFVITADEERKPDCDTEWQE